MYTKRSICEYVMEFRSVTLLNIDEESKILASQPMKALKHQPFLHLENLSQTLHPIKARILNRAKAYFCPKLMHVL